MKAFKMVNKSAAVASVMTLVANIVLTVGLSPSVHAAQKIKHCGSAAKAEVESVLDFLQKNINTIMSGVSDLKAGEMRRLRRKVTRVNIKCMDHRRVCKKKASRGGIDRHLFNKAVVVCYNNILNHAQSTSYCTLADVVLHEIAHSAGVKHNRGHNNGPNYDRVYRTGHAAADLCNQMGLNRIIAENTNQ